MRCTSPRIVELLRIGRSALFSLITLSLSLFFYLSLCLLPNIFFLPLSLSLSLYIYVTVLDRGVSLKRERDTSQGHVTELQLSCWMPQALQPQEPRDARGSTMGSAAANQYDMFVRVQGDSCRSQLYSCLHCGKLISNRWHHIRSHQSQNCQCPYCNNVFTRSDNLKAHIRTKHPQFA